MVFVLHLGSLFWLNFPFPAFWIWGFAESHSVFISCQGGVFRLLLSAVGPGGFSWRRFLLFSFLLSPHTRPVVPLSAVGSSTREACGFLRHAPCPLCSLFRAQFVTKVWFRPCVWLRLRLCGSGRGFFSRLTVSFWASLRAGCKNSMNHGKEGVPHEAKSRCRYSHQYDNRVYTCKVSALSFSLLPQLPCGFSSAFEDWLGATLYCIPKNLILKPSISGTSSLALTKRTQEAFDAGAPWFIYLLTSQQIFLLSCWLLCQGHVH